jgi:hypothetical protein
MNSRKTIKKNNQEKHSRKTFQKNIPEKHSRKLFKQDAQGQTAQPSAQFA